MATLSIPETSAPAHYVELTDSDGRLVLVPLATIRALQVAGVSIIQVPVPGVDSWAKKSGLTVTEAAQQLIQDMRPPVDDADRESLLRQAKAAICRACARGQIQSEGTRTERRIDPQSLAAWCLARRRRADLD